MAPVAAARNACTIASWGEAEAHFASAAATMTLRNSHNVRAQSGFMLHSDDGKADSWFSMTKTVILETARSVLVPSVSSF
jgi:hypothetical protein